MKKKLTKAIQRTRIIDKLKDIRFYTKDIMRYETLGDWRDSSKIDVSSTLDEVEQLAVGVHELVEMILLHAKGISQKEVDSWDVGSTDGSYDPNMYSKNKHYELAHNMAETVEKWIIHAYGRNWRSYDDKTKKIIKKKLIKWKKRGEKS